MNPYDENRIYRKVTLRLLPLLFLSYVVSYLNRVNVGFAKLQMMSQLHWSDAIYGFGAGVFFVGYFLFEVPSNIILHKVGARKWIARIMVTWGLISMATMFVRTPRTFYVLRFALGLAEAGFFPGIVLYLTYWYPPHRRGRMSALFMTAISLSGILGGPLSGWIVSALSGANGWAGWQWLFLLESAPSVIMGIAVFKWLDDSVRQASWLSESEKDLLERNLAEPPGAEGGHYSVFQALIHPRVWLLSSIYFTCMMGLYGISFWLPQLIKDTGVKRLLDVGLLSAIPYGIAGVAMIWMGRHSDQTRERRWHLIASTLAGGCGLLLGGLVIHNTAMAVAALTLATAGVLSSMPLFWTLPPEFLRGTAAAAGIGLINSLGNLAGFVSPFMVGAIVDATHRTAPALYVIAACLMLGTMLVWIATRPGVLPSPRIREGAID
jgi:D-galactonate transporter